MRFIIIFFFQCSMYQFSHIHREDTVIGPSNSALYPLQNFLRFCAWFQSSHFDNGHWFTTESRISHFPLLLAHFLCNLKFGIPTFATTKKKDKRKIPESACCIYYTLYTYVFAVGAPQLILPP